MLAVALGAASAVALVSCGDSGDDSGLLPGDTADQIVTNLEEVEDLAAAGDCDGAAAAAADVSGQIEDLDRSVDPRLRQALAEGAEEVEQEAGEACVVTTTTVETTTEEEPEPETTTTDETTTGDEEETEPEEEEPEEEEPPTTPPTETTPPTTPPEPPTPPPSGGTPPSAEGDID